MSKLWVFGDSYSMPIEFIGSDGDRAGANIDKTVYTTNWIEELANKLPIDELQVFADFGVANEWILKHVFEQFNNFKPDDCVVVQLTNSNRHWFFEDVPTESNIVQGLAHPDHSADKRKAIEGYIKYLDNDNMNSIIYSAMIYSFMYLKVAMPGLKMLLLPGWGRAPETIGNLTDNVCDVEFDNNKTKQAFYNKTGFDTRLNHMSIDNHYILADKVGDYFINQTPVDLTTGFKTNIYTKDYI
jgi:hypothetical protein